jgi:TonB-dependent starch-binding outer membrane protein SusC
MKSTLQSGKGVSKVFWMIVVCLAVGFNAIAQSKTVSGTIKDTDGAPLPGVSVFEKGTTNGTTSDMDGKYALSVGTNATLVYTFIGMAPQEIPVANQTTIDVSMAADVNLLDEVVVIGYGTAKKSDLTGSVVSVAGADLRKVPVASVAESLTGRLAGVQVASTEGSPDAEIKIRIRGGGSITQDNSPLYIVDGFPVNSIADIAPSDIQSIDVLKDASSTAIYGSRGANVRITRCEWCYHHYNTQRDRRQSPGELQYLLWSKAHSEDVGCASC